MVALFSAGRFLFMTDPQKELYKMLATGSGLGQERDRIHREAMQQVPRQQTVTLGELARLREHIQQVGIGKDPEAEDQYLQLLKDNRRFHQLQAMNPIAQTGVSPYDESLAKALDYGELLKAIYGGGVLVKSAGVDLQGHIAKLREFEHPRAIELAGDLEALL
jgi:hypothetical protein